jgi:hypothetical protein
MEGETINSRTEGFRESFIKKVALKSSVLSEAGAVVYA